ncbi:MAG: hypothetical protein ACFFE4_14955 [Candidatus Thorarchaeota archaeon]
MVIIINGEESKEDIKNLLGYMGIEILLAIDKGAKNYETIKLFSGLPLSCIKGRVPVLLELNLIKIVKKEHLLTEKGIKFKTQLENVS